MSDNNACTVTSAARSTVRPLAACLTDTLPHNAVLVSAQVKVVKGQNSFLKYKSSDPLTRHMCDTCGYHMYGELSGDTPIIVRVYRYSHAHAVANLCWSPSNFFFKELEAYCKLLKQTALVHS